MHNKVIVCILQPPLKPTPLSCMSTCRCKFDMKKIDFTIETSMPTFPYKNYKHNSINIIYSIQLLPVRINLIINYIRNITLIRTNSVLRIHVQNEIAVE